MSSRWRGWAGSAGGDDRVGSFAFSEEDVFAEEEVGGGDVALDGGFADVVDVDAAALDILAGLSLAGGQFGGHEQFGQWQAGALEAEGIEVAGGHFADDFGEGGFADTGEVAAEEDGGGAGGVLAGLGAMDEGGQFAGEGVLGGAGGGLGRLLTFEVLDLFVGEEGEDTEQFGDVGVVALDEELVEAVGAGPGGVEPDGAGGGFTVFGAIGFGEEGVGEAPDGGLEFLAAEVDTGGDVAPLVGGAGLQFAAEFPAEVAEVVGLEELVAELGVADAGFAFHAGADGLLADHDVDGEVLSHLAQEVEVGHGGDPVGVVDEAGRVGGGIEVEEAGELVADAGDVVFDLFAGLEVSFGGSAAGVADHAGGAAGEGDGAVTGHLEAAEAEQGDEVADVEGIGGGIEAAIEGDRAVGEAFAQCVEVGAIGQEAAPGQVREDVHRCGE